VPSSRRFGIAHEYDGYESGVARSASSAEHSAYDWCGCTSLLGSGAPVHPKYNSSDVPFGEVNLAYSPALLSTSL